MRHKVTAYITNGKRLLVFEHTHFPEAGIQVPSGTIDSGETPETAIFFPTITISNMHLK